MHVFLKNGIRSHKALFGACMLASFVLYTVTVIILTYYCNLIMDKEDTARYCYYDISFIKPVLFEELNGLEDTLKQEFPEVLAAVSYTDMLADILPVLIVGDGREAVVCGSDLDMQNGAIVEADMADIFQLQYPGMKYQTETNVMTYGCQPDFFAAIVKYEDASSFLTGSRRMMIRTSRPLKHRERQSLMKILSDYISDYHMHYESRIRWLIHGMKYVAYYIIFSICIYIYTMICNIMLLYQMIKQQKKELSVYLRCGAPRGFIRRYLALEILIIQVIAVGFSCVCACFCIPLIPAIQVSHRFALPYVSVLFSGLVSVAVAVVAAKKYEREYA